MLARREAKRLGHDGVDTEQLVARVNDHVRRDLIHVLGDLGTTPSALRIALEKEIPATQLSSTEPEPFRIPMKQALAIAGKEAMALAMDMWAPAIS